ncbi:TetR/AcrR family transcriptional regulator [Cellulomonas triticagri]|uniref:TetR/AcrR family transcriptional regulator n=1 Tax=Cellulomonas triticagri TaxID=2483352 RepID=A0A3M2JBK7_9CELL|nr:TetR/AcrR family transcriptional regulator [Cellulomonas triticagri]RMI09501.1 TetR/AcrR family transcriptional regulator [Cellulomonas triticagri]
MSPAPRPPRGPYGKTRGRVELVARTAHEVVLESGHRALTLAEVARRADLSEAQVLYHFPSRDHLLVAALKHALDRQGEDYGHRPVAPGTDPVDAFAANVNEGLSDPPVLRLFVAMSAEATDPDHPAHAWSREHHEGVVRGYARMLRNLQESGWAHPDVEPDRFARQLMALWEGLQAQWLVDPSFDLGAEVAAGVRVLARRDAVLAREAVESLAHRL